MSPSSPAPLPPEPTTAPAGRIVGRVMGVMALAGSGLALAALWGWAEPALLLKLAATLGLLGLVASLGAMTLRR